MKVLLVSILILLTAGGMFAAGATSADSDDTDGIEQEYLYLSIAQNNKPEKPKNWLLTFAFGAGTSIQKIADTNRVLQLNIEGIYTHFIANLGSDIEFGIGVGGFFNIYNLSQNRDSDLSAHYIGAKLSLVFAFSRLFYVTINPYVLCKLRVTSHVGKHGLAEPYEFANLDFGVELFAGIVTRGSIKLLIGAYAKFNINNVYTQNDKGYRFAIFGGKIGAGF